MIQGTEVLHGQQERCYSESAYILVLRARCVKKRNAGNCSLLGQRTFGWRGCCLAQELEAFTEGVELARLPGLEQTRQSHACLRPLVAARAAADLAANHQRANAALGQIVVGTQSLNRYELEHLILVPQQPLGQRTTGVRLDFGIRQS